MSTPATQGLSLSIVHCPVLGIDVGTSSSKISFISNKGTTVEIVQNEINNRATPTLVTFTSKRRLEGDQAQSLVKSNLKNSIRCYRHLIGGAGSASDRQLQIEKFWSL